MVGESRHYDDTKPNQPTNILTYIQIKEALYERGSGSITFWVGVMWAVKLGWLGSMGVWLAALPLTSCFRLFSSCFLFWVLVFWCSFSIPHGSNRSRGNVKIRPFFAGISWRVCGVFVLSNLTGYEMEWWEGRTGGVKGVPWDWSSHGEA